jgi:hypothetical protein
MNARAALIRNLVQQELLQVQVPEPMHAPGPEIKHLEDGSIELRWSVTNDGYASVTITLNDIGDEDEKIYDLSFHVDNSDNVGAITMLTQLQACVEQFYALGLDTRFGQVIGAHETQGI